MPEFRIEQPNRNFQNVVDKLCDEITMLKKKNKGKKHKELLAFFKWAVGGIFEGCDLDGWSVQDKLEGLGLLIKVKIPKDKLKDYPDCAEYDTDELFFPWYSKEAKLMKEVRVAKGKKGLVKKQEVDGANK